MPVGVDDHDAVGRALEEVGVALERAEAPLGLEAGDRDLLRLIAQRLHDARVAERDGHGVRDGLAKGELAISEGERVPRPEEEHAHGAPLVEDGQDGERAERALVAFVAHDLEERVGGDVGDDEGLAAREHLLDLGVLREIDGQVAQLLVVARGDDVADVARLAHEDDAHAVDLRHLGDALHDREEDAAEVEVRGERLRELEDDCASCSFLASASTTPRSAELPADARHELDRLERLADEVVGARLEGRAISSSRVERGEHDDGQVARLGSRPQNAQSTW